MSDAKAYSKTEGKGMDDIARQFADFEKDYLKGELRGLRRAVSKLHKLEATEERLSVIDNRDHLIVVAKSQVERVKGKRRDETLATEPLRAARAVKSLERKLTSSTP